MRKLKGKGEWSGETGTKSIFKIVKQYVDNGESLDHLKCEFIVAVNLWLWSKTLRAIRVEALNSDENTLCWMRGWTLVNVLIYESYTHCINYLQQH